jgi:hypothetical protein
MREDTMPMWEFVQQPNLNVLKVYLDCIMRDYVE